MELCGKGGTPRLARRRPLRVSQPLQKAATTTTEGSGSSTPSPSAETRAAVNLSAIFHSDDQSAALVADLIANLDVTSASTVPPAPAAAAVAATSSAIITSELTDAQVAAITQDGPLVREP